MSYLVFTLQYLYFFVAKIIIFDMIMIRKIFTLDRKLRLCWNRYTTMLTAKTFFSQSSSSLHGVSENVPVSQQTTDDGYRRLELFLIGFASVFITFLWVGVFSAVLQDRAVRMPFAGTGVVATVARSVSDQVTMSARGVSDAGVLLADAVVYQFTSIYETSCLTQGSCGGDFAILTKPLQGSVATVENIAENSDQVINLVRSAGSFRIADTGVQIVAAISPEKVYADNVLGAAAVSSEVLIGKGMREYYQYVDTMTFGAITAIDPELTRD